MLAGANPARDRLTDLAGSDDDDRICHGYSSRDPLSFHIPERLRPAEPFTGALPSGRPRAARAPTRDPDRRYSRFSDAMSTEKRYFTSDLSSRP